MSIRVDSSSLISGAVVVGVPGLGVLAESVPSTGEHGGGIAATWLGPEDAGKEARVLVTTWPAAGTLFVFEDTSFDYDGSSTSFEAQLYLDGVAVGTPQPVTITVGGEAADLSGAAVSISTAAGTLVTSIQLAGSAASLSTAGGNLTAQITLSGAALAQAAATAALTAGAADLAGDAHATAAAIGTLTTQIRLSGAAVSQALAGADLTTESAGLSGSAQASATAMGLLGTGIPLVGQATATASAAGSLGVPILLSGAAAAVSSATGELTIALALEGSALAAALASGSLTTEVRLNGAAVSNALASAVMTGGAEPPEQLPIDAYIAAYLNPPDAGRATHGHDYLRLGERFARRRGLI